MITFPMILQTIISGLTQGSVYATIAVGLSLAFGLMREVNWAQGELLALALYISFFAVTELGMDPYLTMLITIPVMFIVGFLIQKYSLNKLLAKDPAREPLTILLFTAGLGMFISNIMTFIFTSNSRYTTTKYTATSFILNDGNLVISKPKLISGVFALVATLILYLVVQKTEFGRALRATAQNRHVAQLMGINNTQIYSIAYGLGIAMVGLAAALLIPIITITPTVGANYSTKCFIIVVLGGRGSIPGCLVGGILVGLIERFGTLFLSDTYSQLIVFAVFFLVLMFRPNGFFGKES